MSELARSGKGVFILAVSVKGNWDESTTCLCIINSTLEEVIVNFRSLTIYTERVKTDIFVSF